MNSATPPTATLAELEERCRKHPGDIGALALFARGLGQAGRFREAVAGYQQALELAPQSAELWFNLGNAEARCGETAAAMLAYRKALAINPGLTPAVFNLANQLRDSGEQTEATKLYQQATQQQPGMALAWSCLGNILREQGKTDEAIAAHRTALMLEANQADHHYNLANALRDGGRGEEAQQAYETALRLNSGHFRARLNLGLLQLSNEARDAAVEQFQGLLAVPTRDVEALTLAARTQFQLGMLDAAIALLERVLALQPDHADALLNLGTAYGRKGQHDLAIPRLRQALTFTPNKVDAQANLAHALIQVGHATEAMSIANKLRQTDPKLARAWALESQALMQQARIPEALECQDAAIALEPENTGLVSQRLFSSLYDERLGADDIISLHRELAGRITLNANREPAAELQPRPPRSARRPLRVGYLSQDFLAHPVGFFMEPILENHNTERVFSICYSDRERDDATARALRRTAGAWRNCESDSDDELFAKMQQDELDVLIDLGGHSAGAKRMGLLARRAAPMQMLYLGYPNSSGLATMDYVIADQHICPPDRAHLMSERVLRPAPSFLCFKPPRDAPNVAEAPCLRNGYISFGCYNHSPKLSNATIELWAAVLGAVEGSQLVLKASPFAEKSTRDYTIQRFVKAGIAAKRLRLLPPTTPLSRHLQDFGQIDIALDPTPFNGGTTSCQTLWMGVPLVSLVGDSFHGRMGLSLLSAIGCEQWVARSSDEYVAVCQQLASNPKALQDHRRSLRERMLASPLCDAAGFTRGLEDTLVGLGG